MIYDIHADALVELDQNTTDDLLAVNQAYGRVRELVHRRCQARDYGDTWLVDQLDIIHYDLQQHIKPR